MIGKIILKGLKYNLKIGVSEQERVRLQPILIDLQLYLDIGKAVATEDIEETVNYSTVQKTIKKFVEDKEYILVEKLTVDIVDLLFSEFRRVKAVKCICWKPEALKDAENVGVAVVRKRK